MKYLEIKVHFQFTQIETNWYHNGAERISITDIRIGLVKLIKFSGQENISEVKRPICNTEHIFHFAFLLVQSQVEKRLLLMWWYKDFVHLIVNNGSLTKLTSRNKLVVTFLSKLKETKASSFQFIWVLDPSSMTYLVSYWHIYFTMVFWHEPAYEVGNFPSK